MTRCHGTLALWKGWVEVEVEVEESVGEAGKCLRQIPTWRGRWAVGGGKGAD